MTNHPYVCEYLQNLLTCTKDLYHLWSNFYSLCRNLGMRRAIFLGAIAFLAYFVSTSMLWAEVLRGRIAAGPGVVLGLSHHNKIVSAGQNEAGQLGRASGNFLSGEMAIEGPLASANVLAIAAGVRHGVALLESGEVLTWGGQEHGSSDGDINSAVPFNFGSPVAWVRVGAYNSFAYTQNQQLWVRGRNHKGQLGLGDSSDRTTWTMVGSLPSGNLQDLSAGIEHTLFLISGNIYGCGSQGFGQLGGAPSGLPVTNISLIDESRMTTRVLAGGFHSLSIDANQKAWAWGKNHRGQLGLGHVVLTSEPTEVQGLNSMQVLDVAAGHGHSLFLVASDSGPVVYVAGDNESGQLGLTGLKFSMLPMLMPPLPESAYGSSIDAVVGGPYTTVLLYASQRRILSFGQRHNGTWGAEGELFWEDLTSPTYSITYFANGGTGTIPTGNKIYGVGYWLSDGGELSKLGHNFVEWSTASDGSGTAYASGGNYLANMNLNLYAQWTVQQYTLSFDNAGGSAVGDITQDFGSAISPPTEPTKVGYSFAGWAPLLPSTMSSNNATHTAQWIVQQYTLSFDSAGGSAVGDITQDFGSAITPPTEPTKAGYSFAGWAPSLPSTMPANNSTHTAQWTSSTSGEQMFSTPGSYSWTAPAGVTSVSVVAIGAGGAGGAGYWAGSGGGGGGLGWKNNISVTPGQSYTVKVGGGGVGASASNGGTGGESYFISISIVSGGGGNGGLGGANSGYTGGSGGSFTGDGGANGGKGGDSASDLAGGGGGAGGYTGSGGVAPGGSGSGGGGGAADNGGTNSASGAAASGGGVGLLGQGANGSGGTSGSPGLGGSGGGHGSVNGTLGGGDNTGGLYGGGGGGQSNDSQTTPGCNGGSGAVRIIWGGGRSFPSNATSL